MKYKTHNKFAKYTTFVSLTARDAFSTRGVRFTVVRLLFLTVSIICISACSNRVYPDLSHFTLENFLSTPASCSTKNQCKYLGYGERNHSCPSSPIFEGYVIYSTKIGEENIRHLKNLVKDSLFFTSQNTSSSFPLLIIVSFEEEICIGAAKAAPNLICVDEKCIDGNLNEI